ncbi:MAG: hypothetical protein DHS20C14_17730 [Phycisphaeraceae bacterium]|nr:MAG: hypothetical protein DHS20C14_17730 [Phycisphaeraceae bacterium]
MTLWIILIIVNAPVYLLFGKAVFGGWDGFGECVKYWLMPDVVSLFRGEWGEDFWAELKLVWWAAGCAVVVFGEWWVLTNYVL